MVLWFSFNWIFIEIATQYETEIMLYLHLAVLKLKICQLLNLLYVIWTDHFDYKIDTVRTVQRTAIKLVGHVYEIVLFSVVWSCFVWIKVIQFKVKSNFDTQNQIPIFIVWPLFIWYKAILSNLLSYQIPGKLFESEP